MGSDNIQDFGESRLVNISEYLERAESAPRKGTPVPAVLVVIWLLYAITATVAAFVVAFRDPLDESAHVAFQALQVYLWPLGDLIFVLSSLIFVPVSIQFSVVAGAIAGAVPYALGAALVSTLHVVVVVLVAFSARALIRRSRRARSS